MLGHVRIKHKDHEFRNTDEEDEDPGRETGGCVAVMIIVMVMVMVMVMAMVTTTTTTTTMMMMTM
eukprot:5163483-Pyramimonas_sp.AAC.1